MAWKPCLVHDGFRDDYHQEPHLGFAADLPCFAAIAAKPARGADHDGRLSGRHG